MLSTYTYIEQQPVTVIPIQFLVFRKAPKQLFLYKFKKKIFFVCKSCKDIKIWINFLFV